MAVKDKYHLRTKYHDEHVGEDWRIGSVFCSKCKCNRSKQNKMSLKDFEREYDRIYAKAQAVIDKYRPCRIENGKCADGDFCCHGCSHLGEHGCKVRALYCKIWLCPKAAMAYPECRKQLRKLEVEASALGLLGFRKSEDDVLLNIAYSRGKKEEKSEKSCLQLKK